MKGRAVLFNIGISSEGDTVQYWSAYKKHIFGLKLILLVVAKVQECYLLTRFFCTEVSREGIFNVLRFLCTADVSAAYWGGPAARNFRRAWVG